MYPYTKESVTKETDLREAELNIRGQKLFDILRYNGIKTVGDLLEYESEESLLEMKNVGKRTITEIQSWLSKGGFMLD